MKKDHREDITVLGFRSNLETMEHYLEEKKLKNELAIFRWGRSSPVQLLSDAPMGSDA